MPEDYISKLEKALMLAIGNMSFMVGYLRTSERDSDRRVATLVRDALNEVMAAMDKSEARPG